MICYHTNFTGRALVVEFPTPWGMPRPSLLMLLYDVSALVMVLLANAISYSADLSDVSIFGNCIPSITCRSPAPELTSSVSVQDTATIFQCRITLMCLSFLMMDFPFFIIPECAVLCPPNFCQYKSP